MVNSISKEQISALPIAKFEGNIIVVQTEADSEQAVSELSKQNVIGFDTETRPAFKKGQFYKISLIQLATADTCYLFRLNKMDFPDCLMHLLSDEKIKKIGLSLKDDFSAIRKREDFVPQGFIELQTFVKQYGIEDNGLQRIYAILFGEKISKKQRLTNWEADSLTPKQQMYAALDAWACLRIYNKLVDSYN
ncbi:MAG: 3'-5' exonuclease [Dysgonomonas sp.]